MKESLRNGSVGQVSSPREQWDLGNKRKSRRTSEQNIINSVKSLIHKEHIERVI